MSLSTTGGYSPFISLCVSSLTLNGLQGQFARIRQCRNLLDERGRPRVTFVPYRKF